MPTLWNELDEVCKKLIPEYLEELRRVAVSFYQMQWGTASPDCANAADTSSHSVQQIKKICTELTTNYLEEVHRTAVSLYNLQQMSDTAMKLDAKKLEEAMAAGIKFYARQKQEKGIHMTDGPEKKEAKDKGEDEARLCEQGSDT